MKVALLDVYKHNLLELEVNNELDLDEMYKLLNCHCIDITRRKVSGTTYDIICDDEGLLTDYPIPSAVDKSLHVALVGNLLFTHTDNNGNTVGITHEEYIDLYNQLLISFSPKIAFPLVVMQLDE